MQSTVAFINGQAYIEEMPETPLTLRAVEINAPDARTFDEEDEPPHHPYDVFVRAFADAKTLASVVVHKSADQLMTRVVYQQFITLMEAFLGDTFIYVCERDDKMVRAIIMKIGRFKDVKVPIRAIAAAPEQYLRSQLMPWVRGLSWHDTEIADKLSIAVFGKSVFPDDATRQAIVQAVEVRHDLVHRNGRMKDSNEYRVLDEDDIHEVAMNVRSLVEHVNHLFLEWLPNFWFDDVPEFEDLKEWKLEG
ncbi:hypothetical protein AB4Z25_28695 [Rhizobium sp. RAF36]|uniref:hypothetical protein n=1 Tax=Rhizobium sp. RAF36 TaxID=3233055 RepID=UPI003F9DDAAE